MRILYYGVFDGRRWRTEYPIAQALREMGHTVHCVNFRSFFPWIIPSRWKKYRHQIDVVFIQNGIPFKPEYLADITCPIIYLASEFSLQSQIHILQAPRKPDFVMAHSEQVLEWCLTNGVQACRIHHAFNPEFYQHQSVPFQYDLCFIGSLTPRRRKLLSTLEQQPLRLFTGECWNPHTINRLFNQSKLVLHIHAGEENYLPTRFFEVLPTQGCFLTEALGQNAAPDLQTCFAEWHTPEELNHQMTRLLSDSSARMQLVSTANQQAAEHTWFARAQQYAEIFTRVKESTRT